MAKIRITKQFDFEAAHALEGYHGKCKDIHGHSYHLRVTVIGEVSQEAEDVEGSMVMDFSELKRIVKAEVVDQFDHMLILKDNSRFRGIEANHERVLYVPYQPTCENMLLDIVDRIRKKMPAHARLHNAFLRETPRSYAEWFEEDQ
jgi:6-pyruvoyltetrahydropterin/6-carboxytetrahydropterin synthase